MVIFGILFSEKIIGLTPFQAVQLQSMDSAARLYGIFDKEAFLLI